MTRNSASAPYRRRDLATAVNAGKKLQKLWTKRAIFATVAFCLSCASVVPFLDGFPLHAYWETVGKYLVLISMGLLVPFVILVGIAIQIWFNVRSMEKD
jgi:hypothetical protein